MRVFDRHFASDVVRHTVGACAIIVLLGLVQIGVRFAHTVASNGGGSRFLALAGNELHDIVFVSWTLICALGLCSAMAQWVHTGQDQLVAGTGLAFQCILGPGFLLALTALAVGTGVMAETRPSCETRHIVWAEGTLWGAALAEGSQGWLWVEFQPQKHSIGLQYGRADSTVRLPDRARAALSAHDGSFVDEWPRLVFLLLVFCLMLRALPLGARKARGFSIAVPLVGWFLWNTTLRLSSPYLGDDFAGLLGASALTCLLIGALGLVSLHLAEHQ